MAAEIRQITWFTILTASAATIVILPIGIGVAWVMARGTFPGRSALEALVSLPLVMPPVATGLLLLRFFGRRSPIGTVIDALGVDVVFTWKAVVLAMGIMAFPLLARTAKAGFEQVNRRYEQIAASLGASPARVFFSVSLPLARRSIVAGIILAFSRALGEFGATIVVAGDIPGRTRTIAVAIFGLTENGRDAEAVGLLIISIAIAYTAVWMSNRLIRTGGT